MNTGDTLLMKVSSINRRQYGKGSLNAAARESGPGWVELPEKFAAHSLQCRPWMATTAQTESRPHHEARHGATGSELSLMYTGTSTRALSPSRSSS